MYDVKHVAGFEPYTVVRSSALQAVPYDERFRGYGLNKVSHLVAISHAGFAFKVAPWPDTFVVAKEHAPSPDYKNTYGACRDPMQALRIQALYNVFLREVSESPPSPAWTPIPRPPTAEPKGREEEEGRQKEEEAMARVLAATTDFAPEKVVCQVGTERAWRGAGRTIAHRAVRLRPRGGGPVVQIGH